MDHVILDDAQRTFALKRPQDWKPKLPRWTLHLPSHVQELAVSYIGIQSHDGPWKQSDAATRIAGNIREWASDKSSIDSPVVTEMLEVVAGRDQPAGLVFNCYWLSREACHKSIAALDLKSMLRATDSTSTQRIGVWCEILTPSLDRFETNYSGDDYQPGLSQLEGAQQLEHGLTGYWGAARDRIPASAHDDFASSEVEHVEPNLKKVSEGNVLTGCNVSTIAHIRSGQYWARCDDIEREAYEMDLEPHLRSGLNDIFANPADLGDYGLRFLRNLPPTPKNNSSNHDSQDPHRETCAAGFFRSLHDLESWAKNCPSHHRIYGGSVNHRRKFGTGAKMRTWHEISVLKAGEASWEYINCLPGTGTIPFQDCGSESL